MSDDRSWIVCQVGAREHYSIPRALARNSRQVIFYTDLWAHKSTILSFSNKFRQRFHPEITNAQIVSWNKSFIGFEVLAKLLRKKQWEIIQARNELFAAKVCGHLEEVVKSMPCAPVVFAFSYAAREIFNVAKSLGCPTILGQIDPGPFEMRLVAQLYRDARFPLVDQPKDDYWSSWHVECELADQIIVNSPWSFSALEKEGINPEKMNVVPLAYEPSRLHAGSVLAVKKYSAIRPLKVLFLGQVNLRKGVLELTQAIEMLKDYPVHWTIVGDGDDWLIEKLQELPQTTVVGGVSRRDVGRYYSNADVFILPTHSDGYALTQLEAASYGLPIISSLFCGKVVQHDFNGILLEEVSAEEICGAVRQLLEVPGKLAMYRENMQGLEYCTIQDLSDKLARIHEKIESVASQKNN